MAAVELGSTSFLTDANIKGYWKLEDEADSSGLGHNLTNNGTLTYIGAKFNNGANCPAGNSSKYLRIADNMDIDGGEITIVGWFKMLADISINVFCLCGSAASSYVFYQICYDSANNYGFGTDILLALRCRQLVGYGGQGVAFSDTTNFHHIALTYDTTKIHLYLDGAEQGSGSVASGNGSGTSQAQTTIGYSNQTGTIYGQVIADDVAVFNRALSGDEIATLYNGPPIPQVTANYLKNRGRNRLDMTPISLG